MSWFGEQLKKRMKSDQENFENSFLELSSVVIGKTALSAALNSKKEKAQDAIDEILKFYNVNTSQVPEEVEDMNKRIDYALRPTGVMRRAVELKGTWWKNAIGPMLALTKTGDPVALIPHSLNGYSFFDYQSGKIIRLSNKTKDMLEKEAFCFYKPFPLKKLKIRDLSKFTLSNLSRADILFIVVTALIFQGISMLLPYINNVLIGKIIPSGMPSLLLPFSCLLIGMTFSKELISIFNSLIMSRIGLKMNLAVQSASMNRLLSLPASFFKNYSAGDLSARIGGIAQVCMMANSMIFGSGLSAVFSFFYIFQMSNYAPQLVVPGLIFVFIELGFTIISTFMLLKISRQKMQYNVKLNSLVYSLFSGIQKIKLTGAEKRAFSKWSNVYKQSADLSYNPPLFIKVLPIFSTIISMISTLILYYIAGISGISQADYIAFNIAFSAVSGAILALAPLATRFSEMKPVIELIEPILNAEPEISENKRLVTELSGAIEIDNISFRYSDDTPLILDDISIKINPGEYVAIVGKTGCGKSTLMRLLLGFETPISGSIYYDGQDINSLDLKTLRQHIGSVMQNGKLFQGDIYSNITISAPWLTLNEAWDAAKIASIDKDIENMPMGMHTLISEGSGGVSGGQRQRLMIARAIAPKPSILIFDEATSALDNITQKKISEALDKLNGTRIVIAHRLSTIKNCDRIIVIDGGKIIEDGTYDELMNENGFFADLVNRQQIEPTS